MTGQPTTRGQTPGARSGRAAASDLLLVLGSISNSPDKIDAAQARGAVDMRATSFSWAI